jgi:hypothetical protein
MMTVLVLTAAAAVIHPLHSAGDHLLEGRLELA